MICGMKAYFDKEQDSLPKFKHGETLRNVGGRDVSDFFRNLNPN